MHFYKLYIHSTIFYLTITQLQLSSVSMNSDSSDLLPTISAFGILEEKKGVRLYANYYPRGKIKWSSTPNQLKFEQSILDGWKKLTTPPTIPCTQMMETENNIVICKPFMTSYIVFIVSQKEENPFLLQELLDVFEKVIHELIKNKRTLFSKSEWNIKTLPFLALLVDEMIESGLILDMEKGSLLMKVYNVLSSESKKIGPVLTSKEKNESDDSDSEEEKEK